MKLVRFKVTENTKSNQPIFYQKFKKKLLQSYVHYNTKQLVLPLLSNYLQNSIILGK